ncbi:hypothetical protein J7399_14360 [Shimia sp. R9_1]|uniref:hypothetical protein n=1 Tax=Shimia sp. R9_1 TaxID=2821111 RepID=UPI001ADC17D8|nr:hypothetical protein [Shimia sp. R9_1]MBO9408617.1 hypothetical protein [Shimia sp. R9_1]
MEQLRYNNNLTCDVSEHGMGKGFLASIKYNRREVGVFEDTSIEEIEATFNWVGQLLEEGAHLDQGIIMLGYRGSDLSGDVLVLDGQVIGEWHCDAEEWYHFTADGSSEPNCSAPSNFKLIGRIAEWNRPDAFAREGSNQVV